MPATYRLETLLIEDAVLAIRDRMRTSLNPNLVNVYNNYKQDAPSSIDTELIADSKYYISEVVEPLQPPAIFIIGERSVTDFEAQNFELQKHRLFVTALTYDIEIERLVRKVWRYGLAIWMTLHDQNIQVGSSTLGKSPTSWLTTFVMEQNYSPIYTKRSGAGGDREFRKDVTLTLEAWHTGQQW